MSSVQIVVARLYKYCYNTNMKKNDEFEVLIEDMGSSGEGIAHKDGVTIFVPFAIKGENVLVHVLKVKESIAWAKIITIKSYCEHRVEPNCKYFEKCGGCALEHVNSEYELLVKQQKIETAFKKNAGITLEKVKMFDSDKLYSYRNKCAFPIRMVDGVASVCMFKGNSHIPIKINRCELADEKINEVVSIFNKFLRESSVSAFDELTNIGLVKFLVVRVIDNVPLITIVINTKKMPNIDGLIKKLELRFAKFGLNLNINTTNNNVILSSNFVHVCGEKELVASEKGISYPVSSMSFLQINDYIKNIIYDKVLDAIEKQDLVIDAYSGAGLLSAIMAKKAKYVYGIEIIKDATENANNLKISNNIENLTNINGDCLIELPRLVECLNSNQVKVVLDPPRKGCDKKVIDAIIKANVKEIIYISCNPATLARDAKILIDAGYKIKSVEGFNMFPQTEHVETLAFFEKEI